MAYRLGIDTGGTHTDLVLVEIDSGRVSVLKVPSTPADPVDAIVDGILAITQRDGVHLDEIETIVYGTTVVVNRIIQGQRTSTGLITTEGFRDVIEIGKSHREGDIYDVQLAPRLPIVPRELRFPIRERVDFRGSVVVPLDERDVRAAASALREAQVESVAVCLLHSYANDVHEVRVREMLGTEMPGVPVSISSAVSPTIFEYERSSTTALDAFVKAPLQEHFDRFERRLTAMGIRAHLLTMQGNGGTMSLSSARAMPVRVSNSGPVAGAIAGAFFARQCGYPNAISIDMGGTSTDVAIILGGVPVVVPRDEIQGHPVQLAGIEIKPIGSGGGSIAWLDDGGALRVGPQSAGAFPGPASYGLGGDRPAVTDAAVVAGYLDPDLFLGGARKLDAEAARKACRDHIAGPMGTSVEDAAVSILKIAAANSIRAIRRMTIARGHDPRQFALVAFGGAGGLIAARLAEELEIPVVIVPPNPGNCSATGLLMTDRQRDLTTTILTVVDEADSTHIEATFASLESDAQSELDSEGIPREEQQVKRFAEMRYAGQSFELILECPRGLTPERLGRLALDFHEAHKRRYGHCSPEDPVELVNVRVSGIGAVERPAFPAQTPRDPAGTAPEVRQVRQVHIDQPTPTPVYRRSDLLPGDEIQGPAIVEEPGSTTVVLAGQRVEVSPEGSLVIHIYPESGRKPISGQGRLLQVPGAEEDGGLASGVDADPVAIEILRHALESLTEQMTETISQASYSAILKEGKDCSSSIFDSQGRLVAEGANVPVHLNALGPCLRAILKDHFPPHVLRPGDVILTNDPYIDGSQGAHHTADFIVYQPIFYDAALVGFSTVVAHLNGAGGIDCEGWHNSIFEEGLRIPPVLLYAEGVLDSDLLKVIATNTHTPYNQKGDLLGLVSSVRVGADGVVKLMDRFGKGMVLESIEALIAYTERRTRSYIRSIPDGRYSASTDILEDGSMGGPVRLALAIVIDGDEVTFDYTGTAPSFPGPINCPLSVTISASLFALLALLPPDIPKNQGSANPVHVIAPVGSLVNPRPPAAVYQRMAVTHQIVDLAFAALAETVPDSVVAGSCGLIYSYCSAVNRETHPRGGDLTGRRGWAQGTGPSTGGLGARAHMDGLSAMPAWMTNVASPSIESSEVEAPVLFLRKELIPDSGGPGRYRGGLGLALAWEVRGVDARFSHTSQHSAVPPQGFFGGGPGALSRWIVNEGTEAERVLDSQAGPTIGLQHGDCVTLYTPGGGGYGDPLTRPPHLVATDVVQGLVSQEAAHIHYGVVFDSAGRMDSVETSLIRESRLSSTKTDPTETGCSA